MLAAWVLVRFIARNQLERFFQVFHSGCCKIFKLNCRMIGEPSTQRPALFLSNHISYLDIFILGRCIPGHFIAKSDVANWPVLGPLAKVQNTLFFERKGRKINAQLSVMYKHFDEGGNLILFPEGTSTEGTHVEPFKSSLLSALESSSTPVTIQPITIAYTHYDQKPIQQCERDAFAWYGEMPFASHFFKALGMKQCRVVVEFHEVVSLEDFDCRKRCAEYCQRQVAEGLERILTSGT